MAKAVWKAGTLLAPMPPVMVSCGSIDNSNIITIAWTGIVNTIPPMTYISVRSGRHSYAIIKESREFVINLTPASLVRAADFCGVRSGANVDKFKKMKLTKGKASELSCPLIEECPINLECRVKDIIPLGSHDMFLAEIVAVNINEELIDQNGKLRLDKAGLAAFAHGEYFELGRRIGTFGFSVTKKSTIKKQRARQQDGSGKPHSNGKNK